MDVENEHRLIRSFKERSSYYYEHNGPIKPRKDFHCDACGSNIHKGSDAKYTIKAYSEDGDWPTTNVCGICYHDEDTQKAFRRILAGEFDDD